MTKNLTELAEYYGSDKGLTSLAHGYTMLYELLFFPLKSDEVRLLEMGLLRGGPEVLYGTAKRQTNQVPSIEMWLEYFKRGRIVGLDISDFSWFKHPRFSFCQCDMDDREAIRRASRSFREQFDIIIDDASHASHHQQFGFIEMWPQLKDGGMYFIEDLHWQPKSFEQPGFPKTGRLFMNFQRHRIFHHDDVTLQDDLNQIAPEIGFSFVFPHKFRPKAGPKILVVQKLTR